MYSYVAATYHCKGEEGSCEGVVSLKKAAVWMATLLVGAPLDSLCICRWGP
jgi:hypothetical protein